MHITWNREEGFKLDVPYSAWLIWCLGASVLASSLPDLLDAAARFIN